MDWRSVPVPSPGFLVTAAGTGLLFTNLPARNGTPIPRFRRTMMTALVPPDVGAGLSVLSWRTRTAGTPRPPSATATVWRPSERDNADVAAGASNTSGRQSRLAVDLTTPDGRGGRGSNRSGKIESDIVELVRRNHQDNPTSVLSSRALLRRSSLGAEALIQPATGAGAALRVPSSTKPSDKTLKELTAARLAAREHR